MGRIKQTARKSTSASTNPQNAAPPRQPVPRRRSLASTSGASVSFSSMLMPARDPLRSQMQKLLVTKRKSSTPQQSNSILPQGKRIPGYDDSVKSKPKSRPGEVALKDIRRLQQSADFLIPRSTFHRLVRSVTLELAGGDQLKYQAAAVEALQAAAEAYVTNLMSDSYLCSIHARRGKCQQTANYCLHLLYN